MCKRMVGYFTLLLLLFLLMPPRGGEAQSAPEGQAPGPDVIMGDLPTLIQAGSEGSRVGLMMGTDICNNGNVQVNWFRLPETDHPVIPQNLYRLSGGGANNDERFEQVGQSWVKHQFFPLQQNACGFGCTPAPDSAHLGVGCSTPDSASLNASQPGLGSRAWVNPYTGAFPSTSNSHTGHTHDGTTHRILVEGSDLNPAMNPGATYYGEAQLVTPHEYAWCQSHPGQCNMFNNVSYRQFMVTGGMTSFTFAAVGPTVRMTPAINAWPGATIQMIEPEPGVDGRAFVAYKVTQFGPWEWHYEYAIYNQNLDRGISFFSVPAGCGIGSAINPGFHAPLNHPGIADDGTVGNAGYSNVPWTVQIAGRTLSWFTETFAQNPNANALRWGTLYNFRFDGGPPIFGDATIGFFKTGGGVTVQVQGPAPECTPTIPPPTPTASPATPTPTTTPTPTPSPTPTASPTPSSTPTPSATPTPTPAPAQALNLSTRLRVEAGSGVLIGGFIITGNTPKDLALRAVGPSLAQFGVPGFLADPTLALYDQTGTLLQQSDNWQDDSSQAAQLTALGLALQNPNESGIVTSLPPAAYTAVAAGKNGGTGVGLIEIYDTNPGAGSQMANVSTRGVVGTTNNVMIGGFILGGGNLNTQIAVRGIGPSIATLPLPPELADPILELRDGNGALLIANDDWQSDPAMAAQLSAHGLALQNPKESGIFVSLPPGLFTAILAGKNGGTGTALVEIYNVQ